MHRSLQPDELVELQAQLAEALDPGLRGGGLGGGVSPPPGADEGHGTQFSARRPAPPAALEVEAGLSLPAHLVLAGLGDVDEIRCSVFRSRRLQRRQRHCWMEKAFAGWDWASAARKTRQCLSTRCSRQRNRRCAATTLVVWRTQASKVRRRRRLGVIFETRNMDHVAGQVLEAWQHLVQLRRKCAHLAGIFTGNKAHASFVAWVQALTEQKTEHARIRQCMNMICHRAVLGCVRGWREAVRAKRIRKLRAESAAQILRGNQFYSHLKAWRACVVKQRRIHNLDGDASRALTWLFQRTCAPVFAAWRKEAMKQVGTMNESIESGLEKSAHKKDTLSEWAREHDVLSRRICEHRVAALWTLFSSGLTRLNDKEVKQIHTELRPFYLAWLAYYMRKANARRCEKTLRERRTRLQQSAVLLTWHSESKRNRVIAQILTKMAAAGKHQLFFTAAFKEWQKIARSKCLWRHLKRVLNTIVCNRERSFLRSAFQAFAVRTLPCPLFLQAVARCVEYRHLRLLGWCFGGLAEVMWEEKQLKEAGERTAARVRLQALNCCLILWIRCTVTSSDVMETQEGRLQDFPYDCRVLLMKQAFPYGSVAMSALIHYHRARAMELWNVSALKAKRDGLAVLQTWSALVLMRKTQRRMLVRARFYHCLRIWALWRHAASTQALKEASVSRCLIHVHQQICADTCGNLLDFWKRRVLRRRCLDAKVRKCTRKLVEQAMQSWSWCQRYRSWRQRAVPFCVQRHNKLLLRTIIVAWEEEKGDRAVIRHIRWKQHRVCTSFAFVWWRQYAQERRFSKLCNLRVNLSEMVSKFHHFDTHTGVPRLRTFPFFYMCARHTKAFIDAYFVLWVSSSVLIRRIRLRNERNGKIVRERKRRSVLMVVWKALQNEAGKLDAAKGSEEQCCVTTSAKKWNCIFKFINARARQRELHCIALWSNFLTYHRRIARHVAKQQAKLISRVFEALVTAPVVACRVAASLRRSQHAEDEYMDEILTTILSRWKALSGRKNALRHVYRKAVWHLQGMKRRVAFLVWIVVANRQRRYASTTEVIEQRHANELMRGAVRKWAAAIVHWRLICRAHRTIVRRSETLLLRKSVRGWVDMTAGLSSAELLFQQSFYYLHLRVAKELMFLSFELWAGRTRAMLRLHRLGHRLALAATSHTLNFALVQWVAHFDAVRRRRRHRRNMRIRKSYSVLTSVFTAWVVMMAESWHASIAATEKTNQLCGGTGVLATRYRRLVSEHVRAWFLFVVEILSCRRAMAKERLMKVEEQCIKLVGQHWLSTAKIWRKGQSITHKALLRGSFLRLVAYVEGAVVRRRRCTDLMLQHAQARCKSALGTWARKARIFSHISDLASLSCRILVRLSRASHLVTVTNLDPVKFLRAFYAREREALRRWRNHVQASRYLLHKHALLVLRLARLSLVRAFLRWVDLTGAEPLTEFSQRSALRDIEPVTELSRRSSGLRPDAVHG